MHRRSLLAGVGGLLSLSTAGCLGNLSDDDTEITDVAFETGIDVDKRFDDDPSVTFEDDEIHATGKYSIGNACYDESLEEPSYDPERDELKIQLTRTMGVRSVRKLSNSSPIVWSSISMVASRARSPSLRIWVAKPQKSLGSYPGELL